jgi:hypothetical protein
MSTALLSPYGLSQTESAALETLDRALERLTLAVGPYALAKARAGVRGAYSRVYVLGLYDALSAAEQQIVRSCIT